MTITLREIDELPESEVVNTKSEFDDWGVDPAQLTKPIGLRRWAIETADRIIGVMSAHPVSYGPNQQSVAMNIGIALKEEFRGQGFGATAQAMLAQLLHDEGFVRVEASTDPTNIAEQRALAKAGFEYEGTLRGAQVRATGRHDLQVWASLLRPLDASLSEEHFSDFPR